MEVESAICKLNFRKNTHYRVMPERFKTSEMKNNEQLTLISNVEWAEEPPHVVEAP